MMIYESKDKRVFVSEVKHKQYELNIKEIDGGRFYCALLDYRGVDSYLIAEKKVKAVATKAKSLTDNISIQKFLASIKA